MSDLFGTLASPSTLVLAFGVLYSITGYLEASRTQGESFDIVQFAKTLIIYLVTAGIISQAQADTWVGVLTQFGSGSGAAYVLDKWVNSLLNAHAAQPASTQASASPPASGQ